MHSKVLSSLPHAVMAVAEFFANKIVSGLSHAFLRREWELSAITHMYRIPIMVDKMMVVPENLVLQPS